MSVMTVRVVALLAEEVVGVARGGRLLCGDGGHRGPVAELWFGSSTSSVKKTMRSVSDRSVCQQKRAALHGDRVRLVELGQA